MSHVVWLRLWLGITALSLGTGPALATEIYKTIDENGRVIYTDKPGANSEKIEIAEPIVVPRIIPTPRSEAPKEPGAPTSYTVTMTYPTPETHVNPGTFHLPVQVSTEPGVHPKHRLVVLDNGVPVDGLVIEYIIRGTHSIQAQVLDQKGKVLGRSEAVTVYVHRPTVNSRKNIQDRNRAPTN